MPRLTKYNVHAYFFFTIQKKRKTKGTCSSKVKNNFDEVQWEAARVPRGQRVEQPPTSILLCL